MAWFERELLRFLDELAKNNDRAWFQENKARYEALVKGASLRFIDALAPRMAAISPQIRCDDRALFRIFRDTRFSKDKSPYKTHVGLHFRHLHAGDVHTPGFYLHIEPGASMFGCGIWQPDGPTLAKLRARIHDGIASWQAVVDRVGDRLAWDGEQLVRPPRGVAPDHPHVDFLRRKSLILLGRLSDDEVTDPGLLDAFAARCEAGAPLMADLCATLGLPW